MCKLPLPSEVVTGKVPWIRPDPLPHLTQAQYLVWPILGKNRASEWHTPVVVTEAGVTIGDRALHGRLIIERRVNDLFASLSIVKGLAKLGSCFVHGSRTPQTV